MQSQKQHSAVLSIYASTGLVCLKFFAAIMSGSLALFLESAHGLIDLCSTIMTWFAIRESAKPADDQHHYGHGKIEAVTALMQTGLLTGLSLIIGLEAVKRLYFGSSAQIEASGIAFAVLGFSISVDFFRWRHLKRVAIATKSAALAADSLHFSSDILSSIAVICGIIAVKFGFAQGDNISALVICIVIITIGIKLGRTTVDTLLDTAPEGAADMIRKALDSVPGIGEIASIKVRSVGHVLTSDIQILVPRIFSLEHVSKIKVAAQQAVCNVFPEADIIIITEPFAYDNETILERILLIAAKRRIPIHHVTVQELSDRLSISLDIEVNGRMSLSAAHQIASKLETAIREEFGKDTEVETHIEPLEAQGLKGSNASQELIDGITSIIHKIEADIEGINNVHSIRIRKTERGLVVSLHVLARPDMNVETVHNAVDELERRVRQSCADVVRIVSHAEPG